MRVPLNSIAKLLSAKPVSVNSVSIYNPNDVTVYVNLYDELEISIQSVPYRTLEVPPLATLSINSSSSGLVLDFLNGLTAIASAEYSKPSTLILPYDLACELNT